MASPDNRGPPSHSSPLDRPGSHVPTPLSSARRRLLLPSLRPFSAPTVSHSRVALRVPALNFARRAHPHRRDATASIVRARLPRARGSARQSETGDTGMPRMRRLSVAARGRAQTHRLAILILMCYAFALAASRLRPSRMPSERYVRDERSGSLRNRCRVYELTSTPLFSAFEWPRERSPANHPRTVEYPRSCVLFGCIPPSHSRNC